MAGDTDLDLALAVALAEASDACSDDDFKYSSKQVELRQQSLLSKCRNLPHSPSTGRSKNKRQKTKLCLAAAGAGQRKNIGAPKDGQVAQKHKNDRKDVKNGTNQLDRGGVENCAKSDSSIQSRKQGNVFDSFRHQVPQCRYVPQPLSDLEEGSLVAELQQAFESDSNQNNSSSSETPEDEDLILTTNIASPETSQPDLHGIHVFSRHVLAFDEDEEEVIGDKDICCADASDLEEIVVEESQFSALLRLCNEERPNKEHSTEGPDSILVESDIGAHCSRERGSHLEDVAAPGLDSVTEAHATDLDDFMDIGHLMTQQRVPQPAQIGSSAEECNWRLERKLDPLALKDITNQSGRSKGTEDEGIISVSDCVNVNIMCPICEHDLTEISLELRVKHTEMCLNNNEAQECLRDHTSEELHPISRDSSASFGCEKVKQWLEGLNLSRYLDSFNQHEIDWDTLQWLTDEDLQRIGVTRLGPRRKILGALQELKPTGTGEGTEPPVLPASRVEDDISQNARTTGRDSIKLITNFFPIAAGTGRPQNSVANLVKQHNIVSKHGRNVSRMVSNRPRVSHRPNIEGVPPWMCVPGTPFRVDAFQHLSGECSHWFLTHFHTDHYQGLTRGFRHGRIFCSAITARLVNLRIGVSWDRLMIVPLNEKFKICGVDVTFIDANHCPGSVMILFEPPSGEAVLHTGDFRFCSAMADSALIQSTTVHTLILDTTYCDPQYDFPKQESVIEFVIDAIRAEAFNCETLFLIGTYTIGKERIFLEVGKVLQKKVYVDSAKMKLLECMDLSAEHTKWLTSNDQESFIHVVPLWSISSFKRMNSISRRYRERYKLIVAFSPTGWSLGRGKKKSPGKRHQQGTMIRYEVPYSEHSSFFELKEFVRFLAPVDIIPSVLGKSGGADGMVASLWSEEPCTTGQIRL